MKKTSIFNLTFYIAALAILLVFVLSCQKEETETIVKSDIPLNEEQEIRFEGERNGGVYPIFYLFTESTNNKLISGVPNVQMIFNGGKTDTIFCTKINNNAASVQEENANGILYWQKYGYYDVVVSYNDGSKNDSLGIHFVKFGTPYINIPANNSILNIASLAKWSKITNNGGLSDYGDVTFGKNKKYYTYKVETSTGSLFNAKIASLKNASNVFYFKHLN